MAIEIFSALKLGDVLGVLTKTILALVIGGVLFLIFKAIREKKKFSYEAEIYERDNLGHLNAYKDRFGIILNKKTNMEMGRLKKSKDWVGLADMNYSIIRSGKKLARRVCLLRMSEGQYVFMKPEIHNPREGERDGAFHLNLTREDIDWGVNAFIGCTQTYAYKDKLKEMAPMIVMSIMVIGIVVLGVMLIQKFGPLMDGLKAAAQSMVDATANLKAAAFAQGGVIQ